MAMMRQTGLLERSASKFDSDNTVRFDVHSHFPSIDCQSTGLV